MNAKAFWQDKNTGYSVILSFIKVAFEMTQENKVIGFICLFNMNLFFKGHH